ncbi:MAG: hypothetical protein GQ582_00750 [Methyloprofundus sp.]|nr:hypothetical protein [Methyloprofundus sp.]
MLFLLLIFPVWWLILGIFLKCSSKQLSSATTLIIIGGIVGFMIAFMCNGGASGSAEISSSAWGCLVPFLCIYHIVLGKVILSRK